MKSKYIRAIHQNGGVQALGHLQRDEWLFLPAFFKDTNHVPKVWPLGAILRELEKEHPETGMVVESDCVYLKPVGYLWKPTDEMSKEYALPQKVTPTMIKEARRQ